MTVSRLAIAAALSAALAAPALAQDDSAEAETGSALAGAETLPAPDEVNVDTVVARVGDTDITVGHMIALRAGLPQQYQQLPPDVLFNGMLDQLVQQTLLADEAGDPSRATRLRLENEERSLTAAQAIERVAEDAVTDEAVQAAYDEAYGDGEQPMEYNAAHILVEAEEEAQRLIEELQGGAEFEALARENSTGPSAERGGDLGWFAADAMVAPFQEALTEMEPGSVSESPVETQFGWHVIRLNETRQPEAPDLAEVRPQLVEQIQQRAVADEVESLSSQGDVQRVEAGAIDPAILNDFDLLQE